MKRKFFFAATVAAVLAGNYCAAQTSRGVKREKEACEEMAMQAATNPRSAASAVSSSESLATQIAMVLAREDLAAQVAAEIAGIKRHRVEQVRGTAGAGTNYNAQRADMQINVSGTESASKTVSAILQQDSMETVQKVLQVLSNSRAVCKNAYDQPNGDVLVYVCVEMALAAQRQAYQELKNEGILDVDVNQDGKIDSRNDIDFTEKEFLIELAKAREEYNAKKAEE
jgi:hypothetical protein